MANQMGERATANLKMLEFVARKLGPLNEEVLYLGGMFDCIVYDGLVIVRRATDQRCGLHS